MTTPIGLGLLFLMAIAPALPWRAASGDVLRRGCSSPRTRVSRRCSSPSSSSTRTLATVLAFGLATFAVVAIVRETAFAVRSRRVADHAGWFASFTGTVRGNPRRYGGFIVHIGVICIAVALASAGSFGTKREVRLRRGESVVVGRLPGERSWTPAPRRTGQKTSVSVDLELTKDGRRPRYVRARRVDVPEQQLGDRHAVGPHRASSRTSTSRSSRRRTTQAGSPSASRSNSMTLWIWLGGGLMAIGTIVAIGPTRPRVSSRVVPTAGAPAQHRRTVTEAAPPLEEEVGV